MLIEWNPRFILIKLVSPLETCARCNPSSRYSGWGRTLLRSFYKIVWQEWGCVMASRKRAASRVGVDDLVLLDQVKEEKIVDNLRARYARDMIYVSFFLFPLEFSYNRPTLVLFLLLSIPSNQFLQTTRKLEFVSIEASLFSSLLLISMLWQMMPIETWLDFKKINVLLLRSFSLFQWFWFL